MKRFQQIIAAVLQGAHPGATLSGAQLARVAEALDAADIDAVVDTLDALSVEKHALPDWDGDSQDDIARAQETLMHLLAALAPRHRALIARRRDAVAPLTRQYLDLALR